MFEFLITIQRAIRAAISSNIDTYVQAPDWHILMAMLPMGIVFGVAHAMTPGHSKALLASYVAGGDVKPPRAFATAMILSVTHITSAVLLALIANTLITRTLVGAGRAPMLENISRGSMVVLGLWLLYLAFAHKSHGPHGQSESLVIGVVAGLVPCPLTLFVMTMAVSRGVPEAGVAFAVAMLVGVSIVLTTVAVVTAFASGKMKGWLAAQGNSFELISRVVSGAAALLVIAISLLELK